MYNMKRHLNIAGVLLLFIGFSLNSFHLHGADVANHSGEDDHVVIVEDLTTCPVCACFSTFDFSALFSTFYPFIPGSATPDIGDSYLAERVIVEKSSRGPPFLVYLHTLHVVNQKNYPSYERTKHSDFST